MRVAGGPTYVAHCILARRDGDLGGGGAGKYVDLFIESALGEIERSGVGRGEIEAKLYGGADVLPRHPCRATPSVGRQNVDEAIACLRREGVRVAACQVGGLHGRRISVDTATGEVCVRGLGGAAAGEGAF